MDTRREFIRKSLLLSGAAGLSTVLPPSIQRALAINPDLGSTYLDAEHVVILMQENRSFDHCFGSLQGVRGFNDPRAFRLANDNPVWLQTNAAGNTYAPFRLDIRNTKATWMGSLPHDRASQVDAYNNGLYDKWLLAKRPSNKKYADMPLTLGYYKREDLPFNYALADAFTICDQNFSSAMTSTWPNRHYLWSGTIREEQHAGARARVRNDLDFGEAKWRTFPELLEKHDVSWKVYQNDLTCGGGFEKEERSWLANYTCNPLEYFYRYHVRFSPRYVKSLQQQVETLPGEIEKLKRKIDTVSETGDQYHKLLTDLSKKQDILKKAREELKQWTSENYEKLSDMEKHLNQKAFVINSEDPHYHSLETLRYFDGGEQRAVDIPRGDVLYGFRKDVDNDKLPMVSWLVAPQKFSEHPSAPWYGSWYISEVLDILTKNPEIWKKTIFILTYDENDGYFDHIPPFMPPNPTMPNTGKVSEGIDTAIEYIPLEQELSFDVSKKQARGGHIGLGYRVPMIVASPWSRGGRVNSQVFDHTSVLQFLEKFLSKKKGVLIKEENISAWRRTVCGDLTSIFTKYEPDSKKKEKQILNRNQHVEKIYNAKFSEELIVDSPLSQKDILEARQGNIAGFMPEQEKGIRPSCSLPYQIYANGNLNRDKTSFELYFKASDAVFGKRTAGSPFSVYVPVNFKNEDGSGRLYRMRNWHYAVKPGDDLKDTWTLGDFEKNTYHLRVYGPNGFFREYKGNAEDPLIDIQCEYERTDSNGLHLSGNLMLIITNYSDKEYEIHLKDAYQKEKSRILKINSGKTNLIVNLKNSCGWYDISVYVKGFETFFKQYAGRVETGEDGFTDSLMGKVI